MKLELQDYIKVYNNALPKHLITNVLEELEKVTWDRNTFYSPQRDEFFSKLGDRELFMSLDSIPSSPIVMDRIWKCLHKYYTDLQFPWFTSWNGFSGIRWNKYVENTEMNLHWDSIHSMFDGDVKGIPTLSVVGCLNDDYTGGEFVMFDDSVIPLKAGDIILFPSTFMYPHKINPVISGTRYTFVSWVW
jgi:hypothetical protein